MKRCTRCGIEQDESEFYERRKGTGQLHSWCKVCQREATRVWQVENRTKRLEKQRRYNRRIGHRTSDPFPPHHRAMVRARTEDQLMAALQQPEPFYAAQDPFHFEIGDRAYLHAEKQQRDERWWLNEWGRVENRKRAYKALEGETSVAARRDNRNG